MDCTVLRRLLNDILVKGDSVGSPLAQCYKMSLCANKGRFGALCLAGSWASPVLRADQEVWEVGVNSGVCGLVSSHRRMMGGFPPAVAGDG